MSLSQRDVLFLVTPVECQWINILITQSGQSQISSYPAFSSAWDKGPSSGTLRTLLRMWLKASMALVLVNGMLGSLPGSWDARRNLALIAWVYGYTNIWLKPQKICICLSVACWMLRIFVWWLKKFVWPDRRPFNTKIWLTPQNIRPVCPSSVAVRINWLILKIFVWSIGCRSRGPYTNNPFESWKIRMVCLSHVKIRIIWLTLFVWSVCRPLLYE